MATKKNQKQQLIEKVQHYVQLKFGGSGDFEVEDAMDVIDFFTAAYGSQHSLFKELTLAVGKRIQAMDSSWSPPPCAETVPDMAEQDPMAIGFPEDRFDQGQV